MAEVKTQADGPSSPVAVVLWANVSPEVDARLAVNESLSIKLDPAEWRSGKQIWVIATAGDPKVIGGILKKLGNTTLKGRNVKFLAAGGDGKAVLRSLDGVSSPKGEEGSS